MNICFKKILEDIKKTLKIIPKHNRISNNPRERFEGCNMELAFFFVGVRLLNARAHPRVYTYARYGEGGCYEDRIPRETPRKIGSPVPAKYVYASKDPTSILPESKTRQKVTLHIAATSSCFFPFTFLFPDKNNKKAHVEAFSCETFHG